MIKWIRVSINLSMQTHGDNLIIPSWWWLDSRRYRDMSLLMTWFYCIFFQLETVLYTMYQCYSISVIAWWIMHKVKPIFLTVLISQSKYQYNRIKSSIFYFILDFDFVWELFDPDFPFLIDPESLESGFCLCPWFRLPEFLERLLSGSSISEPLASCAKTNDTGRDQ
jgi:hypothetical protein